jgi:transcriptional regulator GlxA family with amidase domain
VSESGSHSVAIAFAPAAARDQTDRDDRGPLDLDGLAWVAGVSKYSARSFEATYGETPIRYLTRERIERRGTCCGLPI